MRPTLKILFIGCVSSSATLLQSILSLADNSVTIVGAHFESNNKMIIVDKTRLSSQVVSHSIEPGRILTIEKSDVLVKCADEEAIWLCNLGIADELSEGVYL